MDWSNERYVRLYTRDSLTWKLWPWQSRAIFCALLRKVDRAGVLDVGDHDPALGVAAVTEIPPDVVGDFLPPLLSSGAVTAHAGQVAIPGYLAAQEAVYSDKQRQAESRARRRAKAVTKRDKKDEFVTDRHAPSHGVTPYRTVPELTEPESISLLPTVEAHPAERESRPEGSGIEPKKPDRIERVWNHYTTARADALHSLGKRRTTPGLSSTARGRVRKLLSHVGACREINPDEAESAVLEFLTELCAKAAAEKKRGWLDHRHPLFHPNWWDRRESALHGLREDPDAPASMERAPEVWAT
jgi:hypothetical protein